MTPASLGNDSTGISVIILSEALLAAVNTIVKYVHGWSTQQTMIVRNPTDLCVCVVIAVVCRYEVPSRKMICLLLMRGGAYIAFISLFWVAIRSCLPLGDVVVFLMAFSPAFSVLLGRAFLKEKIPSRWVLQFVVCVAGALLINKPLAPKESCPAWNGVWPLSAAFFGGLMNFMSRKVKDVPPAIACITNDVVAIFFAVVTSALGVLGADNAGVISLLPDELDRSVALVVLSGIVGCAGLMLNVKGYQVVSVTAIATIAGYAAVPINYAIQVAIFKEATDVLSVMGAMLIVGTNAMSMVAKYYDDNKSTPGATNSCDESCAAISAPLLAPIEP